MGNKSSLMLQDEEIRQISEETGFSASQIEKLYSRFAHLDRTNSGSLSKDDLMSIPELAINPLCDRLIQMFFSECNAEDVRINFRQFMRVLSAFRANSNQGSGSQLRRDRGNQNQQLQTIQKTMETHRGHTNGDEQNRPISHATGDNDCLMGKLLFVFKVYDADNDGKISFGDLRSILKMMVGNYIDDVRLDKIATRAFVEVDQDNDGFIDFCEFRRVFAGKNLDDKLRVKFFN